MCGISGIINFNNQPVEISGLKNMTDILKHRGPDDEGYLLGNYYKQKFIELGGKDTIPILKNKKKDINIYQNKDFNFGLGFRRLSIIDLTFKGHQPMHDFKKNIWIVFNGEIYNYKEIKAILIEKGYSFTTNSDTEVIIYSYIEWKERCLEKFNGIFSFMLWDKINNNFFFARDRLGVKPFYYFYNDKYFIFGSEIKALLVTGLINKKINNESIYSYIIYKFICGEGTFFKGIKKLLPGYYGIIKNNKIIIKKYWDIDFHENTSDENDLKNEIRYLFEDSIRLQIRSDLPIGAHLSGGIDSSSVVSIIKKFYKIELQTFSGAFIDSPEYSEESYIKLVTNKLSIKNYMIKPTFYDFIKNIKKIIYYLDEPVVGAGVFPQYMLNSLIQKYLKVVLGGQGGDEIFGGYYRYFYALIKDYILNRKKSYSNIKNLLKYIFNYYKLSGLKGIAGEVLLPYISNRLNRLDKNFIKSINFDNVMNYRKFTTNIKGDLNKLIYWDIKNFLQGLLQVEDRTSMAFSVESRVPLLDHRLVELAVNIPPEFKFKQDITKYIFRESIKDLLPMEIYNRKDKKGFPTPFQLWLKKKNFQSFIFECIYRKKFIETGIYDKNVINKIWDQQIKGYKNKSDIIWEMINISLWHENFIEN